MGLVHLGGGSSPSPPDRGGCGPRPLGPGICTGVSRPEGIDHTAAASSGLGDTDVWGRNQRRWCIKDSTCGGCAAGTPGHPWERSRARPLRPGETVGLQVCRVSGNGRRQVGGPRQPRAGAAQHRREDPKLHGTFRSGRPGSRPGARRRGRSGLCGNRNWCPHVGRAAKTRQRARPANHRSCELAGPGCGWC
eukprot:jgi/Botrbrau1/12202/Bobra.0186s0107.1